MLVRRADEANRMVLQSFASPSLSLPSSPSSEWSVFCPCRDTMSVWPWLIMNCSLMNPTPPCTSSGLRLTSSLEMWVTLALYTSPLSLLSFLSLLSPPASFTALCPPLPPPQCSLSPPWDTMMSAVLYRLILCTKTLQRWRNSSRKMLWLTKIRSEWSEY